MAKLNSLSDLKSLFPEAEGAYKPEPKMRKQNLEAHFSNKGRGGKTVTVIKGCLLYTSPSPRDATLSRMPSSA